MDNQTFYKAVSAITRFIAQADEQETAEPEEKGVETHGNQS